MKRKPARMKSKSGPAEKIATAFPIEVACAVIQEAGKILIARRRPEDHLGGFWEFPGGKRIACESLGACLERELLEELGVRVKLGRLLKRIDYAYPKKRVSLYFYQCQLVNGRPAPRAAVELRWVAPFELHGYPFPPADEAFLRDLPRIVRLGQIVP